MEKIFLCIGKFRYYYFLLVFTLLILTYICFFKSEYLSGNLIIKEQLDSKGNCFKILKYFLLLIYTFSSYNWWCWHKQSYNYSQKLDEEKFKFVFGNGNRVLFIIQGKSIFSKTWENRRILFQKRSKVWKENCQEQFNIWWCWWGLLLSDCKSCQFKLVQPFHKTR